MAKLLEVKGLTKHFPISSGVWGKKGDVVRAVQDVSFDIAEGEVLGLVGESGSGKSTIGRLILRLIPATAGKVLFKGQDVFAADNHQLRELRRQMQIVFQDPYGAFNPRMTVGNILGEALHLRGLRNRAERDKEARHLLQMVQMPTTILGRYPHEFSGGQRQRIGIARALAVQPSFIVADEAVSALDVSTQAEIINLLLDLQKQLNLTMLFISHDLSVIKVLCDRVAVLNKGELVELADSKDLFAHPQENYTRELLNAIPTPDPRKARRATPAISAAG